MYKSEELELRETEVLLKHRDFIGFCFNEKQNKTKKPQG